MKKLLPLVFILFLPAFLIFDILSSKKSVAKKILCIAVAVIVFGSIWWNGFAQAKNVITFKLFDLGIINKITKVKVSGTSMLPTIQDNSTVSLNSPKKYGIKRGDIVSFKNIETGGMYYIKRIIALPGEYFSIKNGLITINGKAIKENYTFENLPTFGNTFLIDCATYRVPNDSYLVLGDNRTVSHDSRAIGFINKKDIDGVIKTNYALKYINENEEQKLLKPTINKDLFLEKINKIREEKRSSYLVTYDLLNKLGQKRAEQINNNFNSWKEDLIPVDKLLQENGYRYNLVHEFVTFGYLNEESIVNQIMESTFEKNIFLSNRYTEIGIGVAERTNGTCTYPVISVIISWPSIPTYDQKTLDFWENEVKVTTKILSSLQTYVNRPNYNQEQLRKLIDTIAGESEVANRLVTKMKAREWLDQRDYDDEQRYYKEVEETQVKLNEFMKQNSPDSSGVIQADSQTSNNSQSSTNQSPSPSVANSKFKSEGQKIIEEGITAKINEAWEEEGKIKIKVTFSNTSKVTNSATAPLRLAMKSQSGGAGPEPGILQLPLEPGTTRQFTFSYMKLDNPPFTWSYLNSAGDTINLGSYNP
ncbi:MAG: signal peptidase I [Patescibacteria group bacterium]|nr:signal peptidase I [Patescibacteria group bacterium]